jgi:type III secretion system HrpB4-like protein
MTPFERAAAALRAYEHNARNAIEWADASWLAAALGTTTAVVQDLQVAWRNAQRTQMDLASYALLSMNSVTAPMVKSLIAGHAAMFDMLPVDQGLRMLRVRALLFRGAQVRRVIDNASRRRLADWAGISLDLISQAATGAPDIAALPMAPLMTPLDEIDAQTLVQEGYWLIVRDERDAARSMPCTLLRLALPREANLPRWLNAKVSHLDKDGTQNLINHIPAWLPEWKWLFG